MREVALRPAVEAVEVIEPPVHWREVPVAVAEVPLADGVGHVAQVLQRGRQQLVPQGGPAHVGPYDLSDMHSQFERVPARAQNSFPVNVLYVGFFKYNNTLYYPFREIRAVLPGKGYSSRNSRSAQSYIYKCMLGLFVFSESTEL